MKYKKKEIKIQLKTHENRSPIDTTVECRGED